MVANTDAAFSRGDVMRELRKLNERVDALETRRDLPHASYGSGGPRTRGGRFLAEDSSAEKVFEVTTEPPNIFMRPELISVVARLVIAEVIRSESVAAFQTTTSDTYDDLSTVGPQIDNIEISDAGKMLVMVGAQANPNIDTSTGQLNEFAYMSYDIDGPTERDASDAEALVAGFAADPSSGSIAAGTFSNATKVVLEENLEPGTYTVTAKYKVEETLGGSPSATFGDRNLTVIAF